MIDVKHDCLRAGGAVDHDLADGSAAVEAARAARVGNGHRGKAQSLRCGVGGRASGLRRRDAQVASAGNCQCGLFAVRSDVDRQRASRNEIVDVNSVRSPSSSG